MAQGTDFVKLNWGVQIGLETTPNTYLAPTEKVCMEKNKGSIGNPEYTKYTCDMMSASDGDTYDIVTDSDSGKVSLELDVALPVAHGGIIPIIMQGSGLKKVGDTGYAPKTASAIRMSLLVTQLRRQYKIKGALANSKIIMKAGSMVRLQSSVVGGLDGDAIEKLPADTNFAIPKNALTPTDLTWVKSSCGLTVDGGKLWVSSAELDFGMQFNTVDDFCGKITRMTNRQTKLTVVLKNTEQNETPLSDLKDAKQYNIVIKLQNQAGVDKVQITIPKATVSNDTPNDVDGYLETTREFVAVSTLGDDNFEIKWL